MADGEKKEKKNRKKGKKNPKKWTSARHSFDSFLSALHCNNRSVLKSPASYFLIMFLHNIEVGLLVLAILLCAANYPQYLAHENQEAVASSSHAGHGEVTLNHKWQHYSWKVTPPLLVVWPPAYRWASRENDCCEKFYFICSSRSYHSEVNVVVLNWA